MAPVGESEPDLLRGSSYSLEEEHDYLRQVFSARPSEHMKGLSKMTKNARTLWCYAFVSALLSLAPKVSGLPPQFLTVAGEPTGVVWMAYGQSISIQVNSANDDWYSYYLGFQDSPVPADFDLIEIRPEAGADSWCWAMVSDGFVGYDLAAYDFEDPCLPSPGVHFVFEYTPSAEGETDLLLLEVEGWSPVDQIHIVVEEPADTEPPTPDPMLWAGPPGPLSSTEIVMIAATAHDPSGVQYYFQCVSGGGHDSGWQSSSTYKDASLQPDTRYAYRVKARDMSENHNETDWSAVASAKTFAGLDITEGLVGYWPLDDGAGAIAVDRSGNGNHGALNTSTMPLWQPYGGRVNGALLFDGSGGYVVDEDAETYLNGLDALTVCAWVKSNVIGTDRGFIIFSSPDTTDNRDIRYDVAGAQGGGTNLVKCGITSTGGRQQLESSSGVQTTDWQHLAMTWNSGAPVRLYIDGVQDAATWVEPATVGTLTGCTKLIAGRGGKDLGSSSWDGVVDDVRVYNVVLSPSEIRTLVERNIPLQTGLLTHWKLDESTGITAFDSSPSGLNQGTLSGSGPTWETGKIAGALLFHGGGEHVNCGNDPVFDLTDEITVAAWVNIHTVPAEWAGIFTKGDSAWRLSTNLNLPNFHFAATSPASGPNWINGMTEVSLGQWHHVCGTYDGANIRLYVDAEQDPASPVAYGGTIDTSIHDVWIGGNSDRPGREFNGLIDDVAIWSRALSPSEIAWLYNDDAGHPVGSPIYVYVVDDDAKGDPGPGNPDISDPAEDGSPEHPFDSIQEAIDMALAADTVDVRDGTYKGTGNRDIDFRGKAITVRGQDGPDHCIIDCERIGIGVKFVSGETEYSVLDGFTIVNGLSRDESQGGGGIYLDNSNPVIANCIITDSAAWRGGAIFCHNSSPSLSSCTLKNNEASIEGGGLYCSNSGPAIIDCTIAGNLPDGICTDLLSNLAVLGTVQIISNALTGEGTLDVDSDATLNLQDVHIGCNVVGLGTVLVPIGKKLVVEDNAIIDLGSLGDPGIKGKIQCNGWLRAVDNARLSNAEIDVVRATFEGNAIISNNVLTPQATGQYAQILARDAATIVENDIHGNGERYLDLDPSKFTGLIQDNRIFITMTEGQDGTPAGLFELRGRDLFCPRPVCEPGAFQLPTAPAFSQTTWTVERMELRAGTIARLTNRFDFQPPYASGGAGEVLYVRQLILGPDSVLDTAFNRLYYETLQMHPTARIVNLPLLAFPLGDSPFDDADEFISRIIHNNYIHPGDPGFNRIHVQRVVGLQPDPTGMMLMSSLLVLDPASPDYRKMIGARAKGLFAKTSEDEILIRFEYRFNTPGPGVGLEIFLSDVPQLLAREDPLREQHYFKVATLWAPPLDRPGSANRAHFGLFHKIVPTGHLNLTGGTWIEFEVIGPQNSGGIFSAGYRAAEAADEGAAVLIAGWNPAIWCYGICLDLNSDQFVSEVDFLMVIGECGHTAVDDRFCVDGVFSEDGYVDAHDMVSWDWAMNVEDRLLNLCGVPLLNGSAATSSIAAMSSAGQLPIGSVPDNLSDLLIAGKRGTDDASGKLKDRLYVFDSNGVCTGWSTPGLERCNIRLVQDLQGQLYQLNSEVGLLQLDDPNVIVIPSGESTYANEPRYSKSATVYIGIQGEDPDEFGRPILDAAFDADYVYVVPVVVNPDGNDPYVAAAKLQLLADENPPYQVVQLYDDPCTFNPGDSDNPNLSGLRDIELDNSGNLYVLNVHSRNESDILWRYEPNGAIERLDLGRSDSNNYLPAPIAMYVSSTTDMLYLASAKFNPEDANSTVVYGFSTDGPLTLARSVTITGMHHVSSISEDPSTGSLWVAGFNMEDIPQNPNPNQSPFYYPYLAKIPSDSNDVLFLSVSDSNSHDLSLPLSILWTGQAPACVYDIDGDDFIGPGDFALFACCWLQPASASGCGGAVECGDCDFDCDGTVAPGDLAWFATAWSKNCDDPSIQWPPCVGGTTALSALSTLTPDVDVRCVTLASPSASDTTNALPASISSLTASQDYYAEVWASDVGSTNTGLTSVYVDMALNPCGLATIESVAHGGIFTVFESGTIGACGVDELGGSSLSAAGIEPQWVRVAIVKIHADASGSLCCSLTPSTTGVAALGRGLIPWSDVKLAGCECLPLTYSTYNDWAALGSPACWCAPYQCDGDADGATQGFQKYRVMSNDLNIVSANWKKLIDDATLDPCADIDHKPQGFQKYRVMSNDLNILIANWKKTDSDLAGNCPRPE